MNSNQPKFLVLHCSDVSHNTNPHQLISIDRYHRDERGFPKSSLGFWVGYHYLIDSDKEYQCRADTDEGAHCNQGYDGKTIYQPGAYDNTKIKSMNFQSIGICWSGDGDIEYPTPIQYGLLQKRIWALQDKWKIPNENVKYHRYFSKGKTCAGSLLTDEWLATLLIRPVETPIPPKPIDRTCLAQEAEIKQLKERLKWYEIVLNFFFGNRTV